MDIVTRLWHRLVGLLRPGRLDREIDDELRFHLDMRTQENIDAGMSAGDARRAALRQFGNLTYIREEGRQVRGAGAVETLVRDLAFGARLLRREPGFTFAAVATLALGIAANTAVFSVVDTVLVRPLAYPDAERLVRVEEAHTRHPDGPSVSPGSFVDWSRSSRSFESLAAYFAWTANLTGVGEPERLRAGLVTGRFFDVVRTRAILGRALIAEDDRPEADAVVVLSDRLWRRRFGADPAVVGTRIALGGTSHTVVGIMSPELELPHPDTEIWLPTGWGPQQLGDRRGKFLTVVARLRPDVSLAQARDEMRTLAAALEKEHPDTNAGWSVRVTPLHETIVGQVRPALLVLFAAVLLVLLIACVNTANLLLARAAARRREIAVRIALGASRGRLVRQLLTESVLLALLGGLLGAALAAWAISAVASLGGPDIPRLAHVRVDARILAFTLVVSLGSVLLFGLAPTMLATSARPLDALKADGGAGGGRARHRFLHALVVAEVALALILVVGAGLMLKSFVRLRAVDPGFEPRSVLALSIWLPTAKYRENPRQIAFFRDLVARIGSLPGVRAVGAIQDLPLRHNRMGLKYSIDGRVAPGTLPDAAYRVVTPGYFATLGVPLLRGRAFGDADDANGPAVAIINDSLARRDFAGEDPLGKRIHLDGEDAGWRTIVGVVGDVKHMGLDAEEGPAVYEPHAQKPGYLRWMTIAVRVEGDPARLAPSVRGAVAALDPDQPVYDVTTMESLLSESIAAPRLYTFLLTLFGAIAAILALVGIYGVLAFWVAQRRKEIAVHVALGAGPRDVMRLVVGRGLRLAVVGAAIGAGTAALLTRALAGLLYRVSPTDAVAFALASLTLVGAAALACYLPARRAVRVDPIHVLTRD